MSVCLVRFLSGSECSVSELVLEVALCGCQWVSVGISTVGPGGYEWVS